MPLMNFQIDDTLKTRLSRQTAKDQVTVSAALRDLIEQYVDQQISLKGVGAPTTSPAVKQAAKKQVPLKKPVKRVAKKAEPVQEDEDDGAFYRPDKSPASESGMEWVKEKAAEKRRLDALVNKAKKPPASLEY